MDLQTVNTLNKERIKTILPEFQPLVAELLLKLNEAFDESPLITDANRTIEDQKALYAQGRTTKGPIVTWTLDSKHVGGRAVDIGFIDSNGKLTYLIDWEKFRKAVHEIPGLEWGYELWGKDKPHVQFNPEKISKHWAKPAMDWAIKEGLITREHDLESPVKWGEFLQVLKNYQEKYAKKD